MVTNKNKFSGLHSSMTDEWSTPKPFFEALNRIFNFTLDVCATSENAKCLLFFTKEQDGLSQSWDKHRVWMNPPYGIEIVYWVKKAHETAMLGNLVVGLLPSRTDNAWWNTYVKGHADIHFIMGRLAFGDGTASAPFPSALAIWWGQEKIIDQRKKKGAEDMQGWLLA